MNDWEATTGDVRFRFAVQHGVWDDADEARFDRWLAEVERAAAEKAWEEGAWAEFRLTNGPDPAPNAVNPYRKETP